MWHDRVILCTAHTHKESLDVSDVLPSSPLPRWMHLQVVLFGPPHSRKRRPSEFSADSALLQSTRTSADSVLSSTSAEKQTFEPPLRSTGGVRSGFRMKYYHISHKSHCFMSLCWQWLLHLHSIIGPLDSPPAAPAVSAHTLRDNSSTSSPDVPFHSYFIGGHYLKTRPPQL